MKTVKHILKIVITIFTIVFFLLITTLGLLPWTLQISTIPFLILCLVYFFRIICKNPNKPKLDTLKDHWFGFVAIALLLLFIGALFVISIIAQPGF